MTLCAVFLLIASTSRALPGITMKSYFELYVIVFSICAFIALSAEKRLGGYSWFGSRSVSSHVMFPAAVFYESEMHSDCLYRVNDVHAYSCRNGRWSGLRNYRTADRNSELGSMLATIDRLMRLSIDYGRSNQRVRTPKISFENRQCKYLGMA